MNHLADDDQAQQRLEHASPEVLQTMRDQAEQQLETHRRAACNTHQTKAKRDQAQLAASECQARIEQIDAEKQRRIKTENLAIATRPYQTPEQTGQAAFNELMRLEENLTRAELHAIGYQQLAQKANSDKERADQTMRAEHWAKRTINIRSQIEEFILIHQDDAYKPWLDDDQAEPGQLH